MKKLLLSFVFTATFVLAQNQITFMEAKKDFSNSKVKKDAKVSKLSFLHKSKDTKLSLGFSKDRVKRFHPVSKVSIDNLNARKYNVLYERTLNENLKAKASYIKVLDNIAATDQGKIYGLGLEYKLLKGLKTKFDYYRSDYETFDLSQYDLTLIKAFKVASLKGKLALSGKSIKIEGDNYANYVFKDKDYFTTSAILVLNYNKYFFKTGTFLGKRVFSVLNNGQSVQHHAMQQDRTYLFSLGKRFKNFKIEGKYFYQNGKELPLNQDNVDTKIISIAFSYNF